MKSLKFFILSMLVVFSLLGGSLAGFTDQSADGVSIKAGTVSAELVSADIGSPTIPYVEGGGQLLPEGNGARLWVDHLYPTDKTDHLYFLLAVVNSGSIPIKLDKSEGVTFDITQGSEHAWKFFGGRLKIEVYDIDGSLIKEKNTGPFMFKNISDEINKEMNEVVLLPGWSAEYTIYFWLDPEAVNVNSFQNESLKFNVFFNWKQFHL